jgi:hypothetical protein
MFGSLDFLATATGELRLADLDVHVTAGTSPAHSTRRKAEKQRQWRRQRGAGGDHGPLTM